MLSFPVLSLIYTICCPILSSLQIKGEIKALQTLAVVCSLLRHFAAVVVGVTRAEDQQYLADTVSQSIIHIHSQSVGQSVSQSVQLCSVRVRRRSE
jgi:hypothetical protein